MTTEQVNRSLEIQELFDRIAPVYDRMNNWLSLGQHRIWKLMTVKWSGASSGDIALDICCGSGDLTYMLAQKVGTTGQAIGIDFSCQQLSIARQRFLNLANSISWMEGDALNLPFDDNYFDCATMGYGLRNVLDISLCLQELRRVLKPGAKAAILDFHRPSQHYMQIFQQWYLHNIVVPVAQNFGLTEEYAYITPSLDRFPNGSQQIELAYQAGFSNCVHYPIAGGMMGVLVIVK